MNAAAAAAKCRRNVGLSHGTGAGSVRRSKFKGWHV